jgi:hypothetical protein
LRETGEEAVGFGGGVPASASASDFTTPITESMIHTCFDDATKKGQKFPLKYKSYPT